MKKISLIVIIHFVFTGLILAQDKPDISTVKIIYSIYSISSSSEQSPESTKANSNIPVGSVSQKDIDDCLNNFKNSINAKLQHYTPSTIINGQKQPSRYQIKLTASLSGCPNLKDITFKGNWTEVKNDKNENILLEDVEKINKENKDPMQLKEFNYYVLINYKEGDSQPTKVKGSIVTTIPSRLSVVELTPKDIGKELTVGSTKLKLLEIKGGNYKIEMSEENPALKILPLNTNNLEFSMNMSRNIPFVFYQGFSKKKELTDDDFLDIIKEFDKADKRIIKMGSVSGLINKIVIYEPSDTIVKPVDIDLPIKNN